MKKKLQKEYKEYRVSIAHIGSAIIYIYYDDPSIAYFRNVFINKKMREQGFGSLLLDFLEKIAAQLSCKGMILKAKVESKNYDWYTRCGYVDYAVDEENPEFIWLKKN